MSYYSSIAALSEIASTETLLVLERMGIISVRDMATYLPCSHSELLVGFFESGMLDDLDCNLYFDEPLTETEKENLPDISIAQLTTLSDEHASLLAEHFTIETLAQLAKFDLYLEAQKLIAKQANEVFKENPSAPDELLPNMVGSTYSAFRYSNYVKEHETEYNHALVHRAYQDEPLPDDALMALFYRNKAKFHFGYLAALKQRWVSAGSSLGEIIHSLALAPGESRNIAQLDWFKRQQSARSESTDVTEQLSNEFFQNRAVNEVVQATAQEHQYGSTEIDATTKTTGFGLTTGAGAGGGTAQASGASAGADLTALIGIPLNVGATSGQGSNAAGAGSLGASLVHSNTKVQGTLQSETSGTREATGQLQQNISDATVQNASNVRSLMSTVVVEDDQSGSQSSQTRNVTNYNHMHALTVQYYEVLHRYQVKTFTESLSPVLYVPFRPLDFTIETIKEYWHILKTPLETALPRKAKKYDRVIKDFSPSNGAFDTSGSIYISSVNITRTKVHSDKFKAKITVANPVVKFRIANDDLNSGIDLSMKGSSTYLDYKIWGVQTNSKDNFSGLGIPISENVRFIIDASSFKSTVRSELKQLINDAPKTLVESKLEFNEIHKLNNEDNLKDYVDQGKYNIMNPTDRIDLSMDVEFVVMDEAGNTETVKQEISVSYTYEQLHDSGITEEIANATDAIESYLNNISDINTTDVIEEIEQHFQFHKYGYTKYLLSYLEKEQVVDIIEHLELESGLTSTPLTQIIDPSPLGIVDNLMIFRLKCTANETQSFASNILFEYGSKIREKESGKVLGSNKGRGRQKPKGMSKNSQMAMSGYISSHGINDVSNTFNYDIHFSDKPDQQGNYRVDGTIKLSRRWGLINRDYEVPFTGTTKNPDAKKMKISIQSEGLDTLLAAQTLAGETRGAMVAAKENVFSTNGEVPIMNVEAGGTNAPARLKEFDLEIDRKFGRQEQLSIVSDVNNYCSDIAEYETAIQKQPLRERIFLPSAGVFGEAILGRSNASEYIDARRFYNWQDSPIPNAAPQIMAIDLNQQRAGEISDSLDPNVPDSNLPVTPPTNYPMPTGLSDVLGAVQNGNMFRDMSKTGEFAGVLNKLSDVAASVAETAGKLSGEAAANALDAAVKFGEQVTSLTSEAMKNSLAAMPSSPTERGATLNALDGIGNNPEPIPTNPHSSLDRAKAGAMGSTICCCPCDGLPGGGGTNPPGGGGTNPPGGGGTNPPGGGGTNPPGGGGTNPPPQSFSTIEMQLTSIEITGGENLSQLLIDLLNIIPEVSLPDWLGPEGLEAIKPYSTLEVSGRMFLKDKNGIIIEQKEFSIRSNDTIAFIKNVDKYKFDNFNPHIINLVSPIKSIDEIDGESTITAFMNVDPVSVFDLITNLINPAAGLGILEFNIGDWVMDMSEYSALISNALLGNNSYSTFITYITNLRTNYTGSGLGLYINNRSIGFDYINPNHPVEDVCIAIPTSPPIISIK